MVLASQTAGAQELPLDVVPHVDSCIDMDVDEFQRLFKIEFGTAMPEGATAPAPTSAVIRVELVCTRRLIEIRVDNPVTGESLSRKIQPGTRSGRERLLAIAAVELIGFGERPRTPLLSTPVWESTAMLLGATAWTGARHAGLGIRIIRERPVASSGLQLGWSVDMVAQSSSQSVSLGEVVTNSVSGSAMIHLYRQLGGLGVRGGFGARLGAASITGKPTSGGNVASSQISGFIGSPIARVDALVRPFGGMVMTLSGEGGVHVLGLRALADGRSASSLSGAWVAGHLGLGWAW